MLWVFIFIVVLPVSILLYFLLVPFFIELDSTTDLLRIRIGHWLSAQLVLIDDSPVVRIVIMGWKKDIDPLKNQVHRTRQKNREKKNGKPVKDIYKRMIAVIKSFKVNKCYITFCTDDMALNGLLYPWFRILTWQTGQMILVNFWDEQVVILEVQNTLARIAWAFFKK